MPIKFGQPCSLMQQDSATCPHPTTASITFPDNLCPPQGHVPSALPSQLTLAPEPRVPLASCFQTCPGPGTTHSAAAMCSPAKE